VRERHFAEIVDETLDLGTSAQLLLLLATQRRRVGVRAAAPRAVEQRFVDRVK